MMGLEHEITSSEVQRAFTSSRRIVVGYDGSDLARSAIELARQRAGRGGRIVAVYAVTVAIDPIVGAAGGPLPHTVSSDEIAERILSELEEHPQEGVAIETQQRRAPAASALLEAAMHVHADEIVVGSHGHGRFRALLGSTSHSLVHHANLPVVVLTQRAVERAVRPTEPAHRIVLGWDGSDDARAALVYARRHLALGGEIVAVHAYHAPGEWKGTAYYNAALEQRLAQGQRLLDQIDGDERVTKELIADAPASALATVAQTRDADEIVVGSRGHGTLRAALGSVAHSVLHEADRPVVIVPHTSET